MIEIINNTKNIKVLYLDDQSSAVKKMMTEIRLINENPERYGFKDLSITLIATDKHEQALEAFTGHNDIDVVICDHNMPEKKGLELITKFFMSDSDKPKNIIYVLYTGNTIEDDVRATCKEMKIILAEKSSDVEVLMHIILEKLYQNESKESNGYQNPFYLFYLNAARDLFEELKDLEEMDPTFRILINEKEFSPSKMINEIKSGSKTGLSYMNAYLEGLKFFND